MTAINPLLHFLAWWLPACASLLLLYFIIHRFEARSRDQAWQERYESQIRHDRSSKARLM